MPNPTPPSWEERLRPRVTAYGVSPDAADIVQQLMDTYWEDFLPHFRAELAAAREQALADAVEAVPEDIDCPNTSHYCKGKTIGWNACRAVMFVNLEALRRSKAGKAA